MSKEKLLESAFLRLARTVMDHLEVERFSFVDVVEVFHGDDQAQLQDGQT